MSQPTNAVEIDQVIAIAERIGIWNEVGQYVYIQDLAEYLNDPEELAK